MLLVRASIARLACLVAAANGTLKAAEDGRPYSPQVELLEGADAFDVLANGQVVFVYRRSSLPPEREAVGDISRMISRERAKLHGRPSADVDALIGWSHRGGGTFRPELDDIQAVTIEKSGLFWKVTWEFYWEGGGWTGPLPLYRSYVRPDGSRIEPERALCDVREVSAHGRTIISRMAFADFVARPDPKRILHGDQAQNAARKKLDDFLIKTFPDKPPVYRFRDQRLVEVPIGVRSTGEPDRRALWEVNFIEASHQGKAILDVRPMVIWVTTDGRPAELSLDRWTLPASGEKK